MNIKLMRVSIGEQFNLRSIEAVNVGKRQTARGVSRYHTSVCSLFSRVIKK